MRHARIWLTSLLVLGTLARAGVAAPAISIDPIPIVFYAPPDLWAIGAPPGVKQGGWFNVRNTGDAPLVVTGMAIAGADASIMSFDGELDPFCGSGQVCAQTFSLAPGQARQFLVACNAVQAGYFAASLGVTSNAASGTSTAAMSCVGLRPPIIQISPSSLDFGIAHYCELGDVCGPSCATQPLSQTLTITNAAADPSRLDFYITPPLPSTPWDDFTAPDMCPEELGCSVEDGASMQIGIDFHPRGTGVYNTPLTLVSRYPGQAPIQIPFYAEGGSGQLAFDSPDFLGTVPVGQTLLTTYTVHNAGRSCLAFGRPSSSAPEIQLVGTYPDHQLLQPGESRSWTLSCTPPSAGIVGGFVDFELSWEALDVVFRTLTCEGLAVALVATPGEISFLGAAAVPLGSSATRRVTIRNAGNQATDLAAITSSSPRFTVALVAGSLPIALAPGAEIEADITYTPTAPLATQAAIVLDATSGADLTIVATGEGILVKTALASDVLDDAATPVPPDPPVTGAGCGCAATTPAHGLALGALLLGLLLSRSSRSGSARRARLAAQDRRG